MYFFGFVGYGLIIYVSQTVLLSDLQATALLVGTLFVNIAGVIHGGNLAKQAYEENKL